jgi:hypothetical protein
VSSRPEIIINELGVGYRLMPDAERPADPAGG